MSSGDIATGSSKAVAARVIIPLREAPPRAIQNTIALAFRTCRDAIDRAADCGEDYISYANALADLKGALDRLWEQRKYREKNYAGVINILQLLVAGNDARFSSDQLAGLKASLSLVTRYPRVSKSDYRATMERLQGAGLDIADVLR